MMKTFLVFLAFLSLPVRGHAEPKCTEVGYQSAILTELSKQIASGTEKLLADRGWKLAPGTFTFGKDTFTYWIPTLDDNAPGPYGGYGPTIACVIKGSAATTDGKQLTITWRSDYTGDFMLSAIYPQVAGKTCNIKPIDGIAVFEGQPHVGGQNIIGTFDLPVLVSYPLN